MNISDSKDTVEKKIWQSRSNHPSHDIKTNIRIGSVYENIKVSINTLYYIVFNCFIKNFRIRKAYS